MAADRDNPFDLALAAQREWLETSMDAVDKSTVLAEQLDTIGSVEVGQTPSEVVYEENKLELLHYEPLTDEQHEVPILIIYALINKPFILDLQPDRSVVRRLLEAGHDVYLIDWNEPSRLDKHLTIEDYVNRYIDNCVDVVRERSGQDRINILGYCMGGTMSAMYVPLHQEKVRTLGLMAAGLCFAGTGGVLERWGSEEYYDPEDVTDVFGNVPSEMLDIGFALMDPVANYVSKYVRLYDNIENDDFVENFARMERWLSEGIDVAGEAYVEFLRDIYQDNLLYKNELYLGGEHVDVTSIEVPIIQILGEYDHLIPSESSKPFNDVVGSDDVTTIEYPTGHIGLSVSGSSHRDVWPRVAEWYIEKSTDDPEHLEAVTEAVAEATDQIGIETIDVDLEVAEDEAVIEKDAEAIEEAVAQEAEAEIDAETADPAAAEGADIEEIDGLGPTYAGRLQDAGIRTMAQLAEADVATVAEAANVDREQAEAWIAASRGEMPAEEATRGPAETEPTGEPDPDETPATTEPTEEASEPAGLEAIDGLGPTYADRLADAGIETLEDLAAGEPETVAETAEAPVEQAREWIGEATAATTASNLEAIDGIGPTYADRLRAAGIDTIVALADADVEAVAEAAQVGTSRAEDWIEQAQSA